MSARNPGDATARRKQGAFGHSRRSSRRALIGGQKSGVVTAVDPDRGGEIIWQKKIGHGGSLAGVQWGMAADEANLCRFVRREA
jgi:hypothetical protein